MSRSLEPVPAMLPILLVPGLLCTAEVFSPQIPALWPHGPVTIASTLEGATMEEIAGSILANAPPRFALGGISMGGYLCFEILRQAPERVARLALLDTSARPDTPEVSAQRRATIAEAESGDYAAVLAKSSAALLHPAHRDDPRLIGTSVRMGLTVGLEGYRRQTEAIIARPDSRPGLPTLDMPTLVLVGDADPFTPPDRSEEIAAAIPGARLVVIPECGHNSTLEQPDLVNRALVEWVAG